MINYEQKIQQINQQKEQWEKEKEYLQLKQQLKESKQSVKQPKIKISTSKLIMFFLLLNCTAIEIFTGIITVINMRMAQELGLAPDLTPLVTLISAVVGQTIGFAVYSLKAAKQNCSGGIVYQQAMFQANNNLIYENEQYEKGGLYNGRDNRLL